MRFSGKKWILAGTLSTIVLLAMVSSGFCETLNLPGESYDIEQQIYASQEALYATSQEVPMQCRDCHCPTSDWNDPDGYYWKVIDPHHAYYQDPNSPYNPDCPDYTGSCFPCHFDYDDQCQPTFQYPGAEGCVACHALPTACGWPLELPAQCIDELSGPCFQYLPGGCIEPPEPDEMIQDLTNTVISLNLQKGISNSLDAKLETALSALDDVNTNNDVAAINTLNAFINAVEAQRGNKITNEDADSLIAAAQAIIDKLES